MAAEYILKEQQSAGEVSSVYRAESNAGVVAIKLLNPSLAGDPIIRARFEREARLLAGVDSPSIAGVLDVTTINDSPAVVMEFIDGQPLSELPAGSVIPAHLLKELAAAISTLHGAGIVHRDIRPDHVLVTKEGAFKLVGFGKASARDLAGLTRSTIISADTAYVDPYTWGHRAAGQQADLYGLGATALFAAIGEPPAGRLFGAGGRDSLAVQFEKLRAASQGIVPDIVQALLDAPARRPRSAYEVVQWLTVGGASAGRHLTACLYCGGSMPVESALCPQCGKEPLRITKDKEGEFIELRSISEDQEVLNPFLTKLRALDFAPLADFRLLTGDMRLYSAQEKKEGYELPVRLIDDLSSDSVTKIIEILTAHAPTKIRLVRRPVSHLARTRRGPVIQVREGKQVPPATLETLRRLAPNPLGRGEPRPAAAAPDSGDSERTPVHALKSEAWNALAVATRRLASTPAGPLLDSERVEAVWNEIRRVLDAIERGERYLVTADLAETYAVAERARLRGATADEARAERLFEQYEAVERSLLEARSRVLRACTLLEEIAPANASASLEKLSEGLSQVAPDLGRGIY